MNPESLRPIADHLWQSTLFAAVAGLLTLALRSNRARIRHWVWLTASCKFLIPLSILTALGGRLASPTAATRTQSSLSVVMEQVSQPFTGPAISTRHLPPAPSPQFPVAAILLAIWVCGALGIGCAWWIRWRRIRAAVRSASSVQIAAPIPVRSSAASLEPGVFLPVLILPARVFDGFAPAQLEAVIAHELCHVRQRDNLIAAIHMFVETVFWFHPLVWWIGKRMVEERERACDEEVLLPGRDPRVYAEGILNVCKLCVESPLACVSGVTGSNLRKRIEAILSNRAAARLTGTKKVALAFAGMAALAVPVAVGVLNAPAVRAQAAPVSRPKFEVVSVKPCKPSDMPGGGGGRSGGGGAGGNDPGHLRLECRTLENLIRTAYVRFADGKDWTPESTTVSSRVINQPIGGEPAWATSDRYTIDAKPENAQTGGMMRGPMLQTVLEDRFQLKIHRDLREVPVYALVAGKGSPKLQASKKDSCTEIDFTSDLPPAPRPDQPPLCGPFRRDKNGGTETFGQTLAGLCKQFSAAVDRDVVDRTGLAGKFDIHLELSFDDLFPFARRDNAGDPAAAAVPSDPLSAIMAAVQRLGLRLEPAKATGEFLVIDHVERPSEN